MLLALSRTSFGIFAETWIDASGPFVVLAGLRMAGSGGVLSRVRKLSLIGLGLATAGFLFS